MGIPNRQLVNRYLAHLKRRGAAIRTLSSYATDLTQALRSAPDPLTPRTLKKYIANYTVSLSTLSVNTRARKLTTLRNFLIWSYQQGYFPVDAGRAIVRPRRHAVLTSTLLSQARIARLRSAAVETSDRLLLELMLQTGMRLPEAVAITIKHVDAPPGYLRHPVSGIRIPITLPLRQALEYDLAAGSRNPRHPLVSSQRSSRPITQRTAALRLEKLARRAKVRGATPRNLRATFIARQLSAGVPVEFIQKIVGHQSPATTQSYATLSVPTSRPENLLPI